ARTAGNGLGQHHVGSSVQKAHRLLGAPVDRHGGHGVVGTEVGEDDAAVFDHGAFAATVEVLERGFAVPDFFHEVGPPRAKSSELSPSFSKFSRKSRAKRSTSGPAGICRCSLSTPGQVRGTSKPKTGCFTKSAL